MAMASTPSTPLPPSLEMFQKGVNLPLFNVQSLVPRPLSDATEMFDTDFEEDDSDVEPNSPRISIESLGKKSDTTASSVDEATTPHTNSFHGFDFGLRQKPSVEGPRGPHLFRNSQDSSQSLTFELEVTQLTPAATRPTSNTVEALPHPHHTKSLSTLPQAVAGLDTAQVRNWTTQQVATWMYDAGFEDSVVDKFYRNDISGAILVDLKFDDLKELDIQSFGHRHRLWTEIHNLRGSATSSPIDESNPASPISQGSRKSSRSRRRGEENDDQPRRHRSRRGQQLRRVDDSVISPAESVSIVGIEQLIPKRHHCSKGERCAKYRKQQRQLALLAQENILSPQQGGRIIIGDPGNPATAESLLRPTSDAEPSVVASSDILGPSQIPEFTLGEQALSSIEGRDPQENVKTFLSFQHIRTASPDEPATPPMELFPPLRSPTQPPRQQNLKNLPKLTIPCDSSAGSLHPTTALYDPLSAASSACVSAVPTVFPPRSASVTSPLRCRTPLNAYRHGTPFSDMDVPVLESPVGPVSRDFSQSVPPNMRYRKESQSLPRSASRVTSRHPSFALTRVTEDTAFDENRLVQEQVPAHEVNHAGRMKKRKTRFLRHEWEEHHFTLKGTTLAMHEDEKTSEELERIDVDNYSVACSAIQSNKLSAALKAMKLAGRKEVDPAAFSFQLVPALEKKGVKNPALGKTHHFAVKNRDQRIDWMRELMLAKALKLKGDGFDVDVNGHMI